LRWVEYRALRGSFALHRRLEQSLAGISQLIVSGLSMKRKDGAAFTVVDFMPHEAEREAPELEDENESDAEKERNKPYFQKL
jgi:hypothetical protein